MKFLDLTTDQTPLLGQEMAQIDPWLRLGFPAEVLTSYLNRPDPSLQRTVLMVQGQMVGALAIRSPWLRGPYLELLVIFPEHQGKGYGAKALNWAFQRAETGNSHNFWACVSAFNQAARDFYTRMGFTETTELTDLVAHGESEILLRKIL